MQLYRFLECAEHAEAWVNGGAIPLRPASAYLSDKRSGIMTPDETYQCNSTLDVDANDAQSLSHMLRGMGAAVSYFTGSVYITPAGRRVPLNGEVRSASQDAYVLCFSDSVSKADMRKMGKSVAVRIVQQELLTETLNDFFGTHSNVRQVAYTKGLNRNHWLKSWPERYMREHRLVWPTEEDGVKWVMLPPGIAEFVNSNEIPDQCYGDHLEFIDDVGFRWSRGGNSSFRQRQMGEAARGSIFS